MEFFSLGPFWALADCPKAGQNQNGKQTNIYLLGSSSGNSHGGKNRKIPQSAAHWAMADEKRCQSTNSTHSCSHSPHLCTKALCFWQMSQSNVEFPNAPKTTNRYLIFCNSIHSFHSRERKCVCMCQWVGFWCHTNDPEISLSDKQTGINFGCSLKLVPGNTRQIADNYLTPLALDDHIEMPWNNTALKSGLTRDYKKIICYWRESCSCKLWNMALKIKWFGLAYSRNRLDLHFWFEYPKNYIYVSSLFHS